MYRSAISANFSAAHFLKNYSGRCENLHGHNWRVEVVVGCASLDDVGMGMDFTALREKTAAILAALDHSVLNELPAFWEVNPSSENIARHIFTELEGKVTDSRIRLLGVKVWESETSWAEYRPEA